MLALHHRQKGPWTSRWLAYWIYFYPWTYNQLKRSSVLDYSKNANFRKDKFTYTQNHLRFWVCSRRYPFASQTSTGRALGYLLKGQSWFTNQEVNISEISSSISYASHYLSDHFVIFLLWASSTHEPLWTRDRDRSKGCQVYCRWVLSHRPTKEAHEWSEPVLVTRPVPLGPSRSAVPKCWRDWDQWYEERDAPLEGRERIWVCSKLGWSDHHSMWLVLKEIYGSMKQFARSDCLKWGYSQFSQDHACASQTVLQFRGRQNTVGAISYLILVKEVMVSLSST